MTICPNCGTEVQRGGRGRGREFCPGKCRSQFHKRAETQGRAVIMLLKAWIEGKGGGHTPINPTSRWAMGELTLIVREMVQDDREAKRPSAIDYVQKQIDSGFRHMDRKRR